LSDALVVEDQDTTLGEGEEPLLVYNLNAWHEVVS
jgi:hypothetical protein